MIILPKTRGWFALAEDGGGSYIANPSLLSQFWLIFMSIKILWPSVTIYANAKKKSVHLQI